MLVAWALVVSEVTLWLDGFGLASGVAGLLCEVWGAVAPPAAVVGALVPGLEEVETASQTDTDPSQIPCRPPAIM